MNASASETAATNHFIGFFSKDTAANLILLKL